MYVTCYVPFLFIHLLHTFIIFLAPHVSYSSYTSALQLHLLCYPPLFPIHLLFHALILYLLCYSCYLFSLFPHPPPYLLLLTLSFHTPSATHRATRSSSLPVSPASTITFPLVCYSSYFLFVSTVLSLGYYITISPRLPFIPSPFIYSCLFHHHSYLMLLFHLSISSILISFISFGVLLKHSYLICFWSMYFLYLSSHLFNSRLLFHHSLPHLLLYLICHCSIYFLYLYSHFINSCFLFRHSFLICYYSNYFLHLSSHFVNAFFLFYLSYFICYSSIYFLPLFIQLFTSCLLSHLANVVC